MGAELLRGRVALITGAAGGIGAAIALRYSEAGARVALLDIDRVGADKVRRSLVNSDSHGVFGCDLGDMQGCHSIVQEVLEWAGRIDILVNAAGHLERRPFEEIDIDYWDHSIAINMAAPLFLAKACAAPMIRQEWGRIILFSSQGAFTGGFNGSVVYAMAKAGVVALVKSLAKEYAKKNITVNSVAPGGVETPMLYGGMSAEDIRAFVKTIPVGRLALPEEIAGICEFLASDDAAYITGATMDVNGGQLMR